MTISEALRAERAISRMSQKEVAEAIGVTVGTIANWERGEPGEPRYSDLVRLSGVFGKPLHDWLPESPEPAVKPPIPLSALRMMPSQPGDGPTNDH